MPTTITRIDALDIRFPTSRERDGSDAMSPDPDYSAAYAILHTAGQSEQGWYVYDVWESKEHFQRFVENMLGPALQEVGAGGGSRPEPQFFPIETLVKG